MFQTLFDTLWGPEPVIAVQRLFDDSWLWLFHGLTTLGASPGMALILAAAFWLRGRRVAWRIGGILVLTVTINVILWQVVGLPRPDDPGIINRATVSVASFPSGHTGSATAVWGSLAVLGYISPVISVVVVLAVMLSRLYLGVHYLGDVLGGLVVGLVALAVYHRYRHVFLYYLIKFARVVRNWIGRFWFIAALAVGPLAFVLALIFLGVTQKGWEIGGAMLGAGLGLALEARYVRYQPLHHGRLHAWRKLGIGLAGVAVLALLQLPIGGTPLVSVLFALAPFWMLFIAPAVFARMDQRVHAHSTNVSASK